MTRSLPGFLYEILYAEEKWKEKAACLGTAVEHGNHDQFFYRRGGDITSTANPTVSKLDMCSECPVAWECLEYSDRIDAADGVWGGMGLTERQHLLNRFGTADSPKAKAAHAVHIKTLRADKAQKLRKMELSARYRNAS